MSKTRPSTHVRSRPTKDAKSGVSVRTLDRPSKASNRQVPAADCDSAKCVLQTNLAPPHVESGPSGLLEFVKSIDTVSSIARLPQGAHHKLSVCHVCEAPEA